MNQYKNKYDETACYDCGEIDRQDTRTAAGMEIGIPVIVAMKGKQDECDEKKNQKQLVKSAPNPPSAHFRAPSKTEIVSFAL
ncbi:hypothetical protein DRQ05_03575 [bacterium]|nr:MAG: hypothetical protein DRQ05_03575 [bacterium]